MGGLIVKDLLVLRRVAKSYLAVVVIYAGVVLSGMWTAEMFTGMMVVLVTLLPTNLFSWDNYAKWDGYCMALPVGRDRVVAARYAVVLLLLLLTLPLSLILGAVMGAMGYTVVVDTYVLTVGGSMVSGCLLNALTIPVLYKVGPEKGRIALVAVFAGIFAAVMVAAKTRVFGLQDELYQLTQFHVVVGLAIGGLAALALLAASYLISCRIYRRKEG